MSGKQFRSMQQSGFTLIELVVVIVILGILAATAIPRFTDLGKDARIAKMNAALAAVKSGAAIAHASWLSASNGGVSGCAACGVAGAPVAATVVTMEGTTIPVQYGYPDVGGDGFTNTVATGNNIAGSGIVLAAGGLTDYQTTITANNKLEIFPDASHPNCKIIYTEATGTTGAAANTPSVATGAPSYDATNLTPANCS